MALLLSTSSERRPISTEPVFDIPPGISKDIVIYDWNINLKSFETGKVTVTIKGKGVRVLEPLVTSRIYAFDAAKNPYYYANKEATTIFYADPITLATKVNASLDARLTNKWEELYSRSLMTKEEAEKAKQQAEEVVGGSKEVTIAAPIRQVVISDQRMASERMGLEALTKPVPYQQTIFTKWGGYILGGIGIVLLTQAFIMMTASSEKISKKNEKLKKAKTLVEAKEAQLAESRKEVIDMETDLRNKMSGLSTDDIELQRAKQLLEGSDMAGVDEVLGRKQVPTVDELNINFPGKDLMNTAINKAGDMGVAAINSGASVLGIGTQALGQVASTIAPALGQVASNVVTSGGNVIQGGLKGASDVVKTGIKGAGNLIGQGLKAGGDLGKELISQGGQTERRMASEDTMRQQINLAKPVPAVAPVPVPVPLAQGTTLIEKLVSKGVDRQRAEKFAADRDIEMLPAEEKEFVKTAVREQEEEMRGTKGILPLLAEVPKDIAGGLKEALITGKPGMKKEDKELAQLSSAEKDAALKSIAAQNMKIVEEGEKVFLPRIRKVFDDKLDEVTLEMRNAFQDEFHPHYGVGAYVEAIKLGFLPKEAVINMVKKELLEGNLQDVREFASHFAQDLRNDRAFADEYKAAQVPEKDDLQSYIFGTSTTFTPSPQQIGQGIGAAIRRYIDIKALDERFQAQLQKVEQAKKGNLFDKINMSDLTLLEGQLKSIQVPQARSKVTMMSEEDEPKKVGLKGGYGAAGAPPPPPNQPAFVMPPPVPAVLVDRRGNPINIPAVTVQPPQASDDTFMTQVNNPPIILRGGTENANPTIPVPVAVPTGPATAPPPMPAPVPVPPTRTIEDVIAENPLRGGMEEEKPVLKRPRRPLTFAQIPRATYGQFVPPEDLNENQLREWEERRRLPIAIPESERQRVTPEVGPTIGNLLATGQATVERETPPNRPHYQAVDVEAIGLEGMKKLIENGDVFRYNDWYYYKLRGGGEDAPTEAPVLKRPRRPLTFAQIPRATYGQFVPPEDLNENQLREWEERRRLPIAIPESERLRVAPEPGPTIGNLLATGQATVERETPPNRPFYQAVDVEAIGLEGMKKLIENGDVFRYNDWYYYKLRGGADEEPEEPPRSFSDLRDVEFRDMTPEEQSRYRRPRRPAGMVRLPRYQAPSDVIPPLVPVVPAPVVPVVPAEDLPRSYSELRDVEREDMTPEEQAMFRRPRRPVTGIKKLPKFKGEVPTSDVIPALAPLVPYVPITPLAPPPNLPPPTFIGNAQLVPINPSGLTDEQIDMAIQQGRMTYRGGQYYMVVRGG